MELWLKNLRRALRELAKSPLFLLTALLTLGLGIGLNGTIFGLVDAVLFRPLPVADPDSLVAVFSRIAGTDDLSTHSYADYLDLREGSEDLFSGLLGFSMMFVDLQLEERSEIVLGELVTVDYWRVLGLSPIRGRAFEPTDEISPNVAVLGYSFWQKRLGGNPEVIGTRLRLNHETYTVVGIAPEGYGGLVPGITAEIFLPITAVAAVEPVGQIDTTGPGSKAPRIKRRGYRWLYLRGRLPKDVSLRQAQTGLDGIMERLARSYPETNEGRRVEVVPAREVRAHPRVDRILKSAAVAILGLVAAILFVACINLASLVFSRVSSRRKELAVRQAVGADRKRILGELFLESLLLALFGALVAAFISFWTLGWLRNYRPPFAVSLELDLAFDQRAALFTFGVSLVTAFAFGLLPAWRASRLDLVPLLKEGPAGGDAPSRFGKKRLRPRHGLMWIQVVLATTFVLVGALLYRGLGTAGKTNPGMNPDSVAVVALHLGSLHATADETLGIYRRLLAEAENLARTSEVALADRLPFSLNPHSKKIFPEGSGAETEGRIVDTSSVSPGYFKTLDIPLLKGRSFDNGDRLGNPIVAVATPALLDRLDLEDRPLGKTFLLGSIEGPRATIIGIVADHKIRSLAESPRPMLYLSQYQQLGSATHLVARAVPGEEGESLLDPLLEAALTAHSEALPLQTTTLRKMVDLTLFPTRAGAALCAFFGILAIFLAMLGLYSKVAFEVSQRRKEIGIRTAVGADSTRILWEVLRSGARITMAGVGVGLVLGAILGGRLELLLHGVSPWDFAAWTFTLFSVLLTALLAHVGPALAALRISPQEALREE